MSSSNHRTLSRFVERLQRHSGLSDEEREAILAVRSEASQVAAHRDIVRPGHRVDHACLVVSGLAGRFDEMLDGRRQITNFHIPGDMCDLHSVVVPKASWSVTACTTTTVLHVPHADLREIASRHPRIAMAFWRDTVIDASVLAKWVGNLGRKDAQARVAHLLCEMGMRLELAHLGSRTSYEFGITQEQLADAVGMTAVHVNRTLQALRGAGLISFHARTVEIHDWDRLVQVAEFDPDYLHSNPRDHSPSGAAAPARESLSRAFPS